MKFTKMHGIGNDYVYVNGFEERVDDPAGVAKRVSDRHFGIGADGLILIGPSEAGDVRMRMFNADGSESEMCGNGIRCVAKYAYEHGLAKKNPIAVETGRGVLTVSLELEGEEVRRATVDMGAPILELSKIPVNAGRIQEIREHVYEAPGLVTGLGGAKVAPGWASAMTFVSMGNPHAVAFVEDVEDVELEKFGPLVEHNSAFPKRINFHVVRVHSQTEVTMRTWERGSGITLACGTGACAVVVAASLRRLTGRKVLAHLAGGDLSLEWRMDNQHVMMTGPAVEVFSGEWAGSRRGVW